MDETTRIRLEAQHCLLMALVMTHPDRKLLESTFASLIPDRVEREHANPGLLRQALHKIQKEIT